MDKKQVDIFTVNSLKAKGVNINGMNPPVLEAFRDILFDVINNSRENETPIENSQPLDFNNWIEKEGYINNWNEFIKNKKNYTIGSVRRKYKKYVSSF